MAGNPIDLELELKGIAGTYEAELRLDRGMDSTARFGPFPTRLAPADLLALASDPTGYGGALTEMLFASPVMSEAFFTARGMALAQDSVLRLRLVIGSG